MQQLQDLGADYAGMIFYEKSKRFIGDFAESEKQKIKSLAIKKVGVFVNADYEAILKAITDYDLHAVQLHGDETAKYCEKIADYVSVVKAFRLSDNDSVEWMIRPYMEMCDMFMFDTMGAGYGGTGKKFDWTMLNNSDIGKPFFLSGGIEPGDEDRLNEFVKEPVAKALFAVDINSRFEVSPGIKDMKKVKNFVTNLNNGQHL